MPPLTFTEARALGADRDYPPFHRSLRDGFAVRAADVPGTLDVIGEVRAGHRFEGTIQPGQSVTIMTGAPVPEGADAVVMLEDASLQETSVTISNPVQPGEHVCARGTEAQAGATVLKSGQVIGYPEMAVLATIGLLKAPVYRRPQVAIITTGDEIRDARESPQEHQIRDSNLWSLACQIRRAGGTPVVFPAARDNVTDIADAIGKGLQTDLLVMSGGVSAGKYDLVENVLKLYGAEFYFDRVQIQPGRPAVFGRAKDTFFFGLPGNPASTMVCFELFARPALELLSGRNSTLLPLTESVLAVDFDHRPGLTRFLPAVLSEDGARITPVPWTSSGDVMALARANVFLVAEPDKPHYAAGERIRVLMR